jgi:predicted dehydrogenase
VIRYDARWNDKIIIYGPEQEPQEYLLEVKGTRVWGHRQIDEHFIECILHNKKPQVTVNDAIKAQEIAQKILNTNNHARCRQKPLIAHC